MKKLVYAAVFTALFSVGLLSLTSVSSSATPKGQTKVTLCHATHSETNPFVQITVAVPSVVFNGHDTHQDNEDIIPPFAGYPGKNWDATGQSIWSNGCKVKKATTTTTAKPTTTTTAKPTTTTLCPPKPTTTSTTVAPTTTTVAPTTTTVAPTTTTAPPETTTTTVPQTTTSTSVAPTTSTTVAPPTSTSSSSTTLVPGTSTSTTTVAPAATEVTPNPPSMARTGFEMVLWVGLGTLCLIAGTVLLLWDGRRKPQHLR